MPTASLANDVVHPNVRNYRNLDCAVFNMFYNESDEAKKPIETARAAYVPTSNKKRIWEGSWIYVDSHIQICVRKPKNILAIWHVKTTGEYGKETEEE